MANSKVYCKLGNGTVRDLTQDNNTVYTHPATKQCNYTYTHPSTQQCQNANATKLSGYTYSQIVANASSSIGAKVRFGTDAWECNSSRANYEDITVSFDGFSSTPTVVGNARHRGIISGTSVQFAAPVSCVSVTTTSAKLRIFPGNGEAFSYTTGTLYWIAVGS